MTNTDKALNGAHLDVVNGTGDYNDGTDERGATIDLLELAEDMRHAAERLVDVPELVGTATCWGSCDGPQMLRETKAEGDLAALAGEMEWVADRLRAVRHRLTGGRI